MRRLERQKKQATVGRFFRRLSSVSERTDAEKKGRRGYYENFKRERDNLPPVNGGRNVRVEVDDALSVVVGGALKMVEGRGKEEVLGNSSEN